ncbi:MAG: SRPBCC domain-containing protein [Planctomycetota bacterium]
MNAPTLQVSTPSDTEIVMTRAFQAPRPLVWEAMTSPAKLPLWLFSPPGWTMTTCEGEPRLGGGYRWGWSDEHGQSVMLIHGVFLEVEPPARIVHTEIMEMGQCGPVGQLVAKTELTERSGTTQMRMTLTFETKEARDGALAWGMETGMEAGYRTLDAMLAGDA